MELDGSVEDAFYLLEPLLFVLGRNTERSGVNDMTEVIVQGFLKEAYVLLQKPSIEFVDELELRGGGVC